MHDTYRLITALRNPDLYGPRCNGTQVLETHISWVILTGEYAYKIKKPVDFGFLDFSTLSQRRFFCYEELRLNRRLARPLYLDVVAITGTTDAPRLNGAGPVLEYAVKLRQFQEQHLGDRLAQTGGLQAAHVDDLALLLARFHADAGKSGEGDRHGLPASIAAAAEHNFTLLGDAMDAEPKTVAALWRWTREKSAMLERNLLARKRQGHVRECHGDLHLGNLVLVDGRLTPFDCIEFSEDLRWIDTINELAFLFMDLEVRGYADLAWRLLNRYLALTGDYDGLALLDYYRVYRAMVRAKIAALSLSQCGNGEARNTFAQQLQTYLRYAHAAIQTRTPPLLIITHGYSGSGKSHLARRIAAELPAVHISSDIERKRLAGLTAETRTSSLPLDGIYTREWTLRTYQHLLATARQILNAGFNVIVDATFLLAEHRRAQRQLAESCGARFAILDIQAPEEILKQRIAVRMRTGTDPSEADMAVLERQFLYAEPLGEDENAMASAIDSSLAPDISAIVRLWQ